MKSSPIRHLPLQSFKPLRKLLITSVGLVLQRKAGCGDYRKPAASARDLGERKRWKRRFATINSRTIRTYIFNLERLKHTMANPFVKAWKYLMALFDNKIEENADPKVQIELSLIHI